MAHRTVWAEPYSAMFRSSSAAATPQRQPLLESNQQKVSPPKKTLASGLRNLLFHSGDESPEHHGSDDNAKEPAPPPAPMKSSVVPTKIKQVVPEFVPPTPVSPPSQAASVKKGNPRDTFHRANSHPIRLDASAALSASRSFDPSMTRAAALDHSSSQSPSRTASGELPQQRHGQQAPTGSPSLRSTVFGSCSHVLSTVVGVLFQTIKLHQQFITPDAVVELASPELTAADSRVRKAKLLYIALLEKAQKERGEWQGFVSKETNQASNNEVDEEQEPVEESATDVLVAALGGLTKEDSFAVLHELLELSFRNLRVSLVTPPVYSKHKGDLAKESLVSPVSLATLLRVGRFVNDLNRDEKSCLLCLMNLWHARCVVDPDQQQELRRIIEERYPLILTECSEAEFMQQAARKSARLDPVAVDLLLVMVQHRDLLFSDVELYTIRQEMQLTPHVRELGTEELRQPEEPELPERSESELGEDNTPEQSEEDLYQDASTQADAPRTCNREAGTQVKVAQTHNAETQMEQQFTQDASTQVEVNQPGGAEQDEQTITQDDTVRVHDIAACQANDDQRNVAEVAFYNTIGHGKEGEETTEQPTASRPTETEEDAALHDESGAAGVTNLTIAAPPQAEIQHVEATNDPATKKVTMSKKTVKKTGLNNSRGPASASGKSQQLQACDSTQTNKPAKTATLPSRKKKRMPRIVVPLVAGTHPIQKEVSQPDSRETEVATELSPVLEMPPRDTTITYAHVGLSIAAAALGAAATLALQAIRKPGH